MKYMVINIVTRCKVELEATCPAHAVGQTPWPWEITECHLMGGNHGSGTVGVDGERECEGAGKVA
jgi:hypothetical protein